MKTLVEVIEVLSLKQHMSPKNHPLETDEIKDALWYLRDYRDLLQSINKAHAIIAYYLEKDLQK